MYMQLCGVRTPYAAPHFVFFFMLLGFIAPSGESTPPLRGLVAFECLYAASCCIGSYMVYRQLASSRGACMHFV